MRRIEVYDADGFQRDDMHKPESWPLPNSWQWIGSYHGIEHYMSAAGYDYYVYPVA